MIRLTFDAFNLGIADDTNSDFLQVCVYESKNFTCLGRKWTTSSSEHGIIKIVIGQPLGTKWMVIFFLVVS